MVRRSERRCLTNLRSAGHCNPWYHHLISEFELLTCTPVLLNTSFNENEPIVNRPEEALECFLRTSMDVLVLGEWVLFRGSR